MSQLVCQIPYQFVHRSHLTLYKSETYEVVVEVWKLDAHLINSDHHFFVYIREKIKKMIMTLVSLIFILKV